MDRGSWPSFTINMNGLAGTRRITVSYPKDWTCKFTGRLCSVASSKYLYICTSVSVSWSHSRFHCQNHDIFHQRDFPSTPLPASVSDVSTSNDCSIPKEHVDGCRTWIFWRFKPPMAVILGIHQWSEFWAPHAQTIHLLGADELSEPPPLTQVETRLHCPSPTDETRKNMKNHCFNHHPKFGWTAMQTRTNQPTDLVILGTCFLILGRWNKWIYTSIPTSHLCQANPLISIHPYSMYIYNSMYVCVYIYREREINLFLLLVRVCMMIGSWLIIPSPWPAPPTTCSSTWKLRPANPTPSAEAFRRLRLSQQCFMGRLGRPQIHGMLLFFCRNTDVNYDRLVSIDVSSIFQICGGDGQAMLVVVKWWSMGVQGQYT